MSSGWIKLHRQLADSSDWLHEPFTRGQAWIDMLLLANHADGTIRCRGIIVSISRGQLGWSEENLAKRWKWSRGKVRRFFAEIESETVQRIVHQKNNVSSIITILNYDRFQSDDTANDTPSSTPNGHQTDTKRYPNKNGKNENNGKNIKKNTIEIPDCLLSISGFESAWKEWLDHLAEKKKKPTSLAMKRQLDTLSKAIDPISVICRSIEKNWQGIFLNDSDYNQKTKDKAEYDAMREFADNLAKNDPLVYTKEELEAYQADLKRQREMLL